MDLLREINRLLNSKPEQAWNKLQDMVYSSTIGLAKLYRDKTLSLVKISATQAYLQAIRILRRHAQLLFVAVFSAIMLAVTVVIVPLALVIVTDWSMTVKITVIAGLGILDLTVIGLCVHHVFSEEKWMQRSGLKALLDSIEPLQK